jgi:hypothetical protein
MIRTKKTDTGRLLIAALIGAIFLLSGLNTVAQDGPDKGYARPANAKDKFAITPMTGVDGEPAKTEADVKAVLSKLKATKPKAQGKEPAARTRGSDARNQCGVGDYKGLCGMWQFDNFDFPVTNTTCGQAAAATIITHWQRLRNDEKFKKDLASYLYNNYGPNNAGGHLGTSWQQVVNSITGPYKMSWRKTSGEADLRAELNKGIPVIVMVDSARLRQRGYDYPPATVGIGAHYIVVYGYDSGFYFVTNHDKNWIRRADFLEAWDTWIHGPIDGGKRGYVFWK